MQAILILAVAGFIWLPVGAILGQAHPEVVLGAALILLMGLPIEMVLCLVGLLVLGVPVSLLWRRVLLGRHGVWLAGAFGAVAGAVMMNGLGFIESVSARPPQATLAGVAAMSGLGAIFGAAVAHCWLFYLRKLLRPLETSA